jgi:hypothetical protein
MPEIAMVHSIDNVKIEKFFVAYATKANNVMYNAVANATAAILNMTPKKLKILRENLVYKHGAPKGTIDHAFAIAKNLAPLCEQGAKDASNHEDAIRSIMTYLCQRKGDVLLTSGKIERGEESLSWASLKADLSPDSNKGKAAADPKPGEVVEVEVPATETPASDVPFVPVTALEAILASLPSLSTEDLNILLDEVSRAVLARDSHVLAAAA